MLIIKNILLLAFSIKLLIYYNTCTMQNETEKHNFNNYKKRKSNWGIFKSSNNPFVI